MAKNKRPNFKKGFALDGNGLYLLLCEKRCPSKTAFGTGTTIDKRERKA